MVAACVGCSLYLPSVRNFCKDLAHRITLMLLCFFLKHGILTLMLKTIRGRSRCRNAKVQLITMIVIQFADDLYISFVYLPFFKLPLLIRYFHTNVPIVAHVLSLLLF